MFTIYVYVLDTLADWELGHVAAELNSGGFSGRARRAYPSRRSALPGSRSVPWAA